MLNKHTFLSDMQTGSIYIISSWSVSRLISHFQYATSSAYVVLKEYCTCISMEYLIAVLKNKERTSTFKKWRSM